MDFNYEKSLHNVIHQKSHQIDELYDVNCKITKLKQDIAVKEAQELLNFDFKDEYGKDDKTIRKSHLTLKFQNLHEKLEGKVSELIKNNEDLKTEIDDLRGEIRCLKIFNKDIDSKIDEIANAESNHDSETKEIKSAIGRIYEV